MAKKTPESLFLHKIFDTLNNANINYAVLRNYQDLPESLNGSDLDILISRKNVSSFYRILEDDILKTFAGHIICRYGKYTPRICIIAKPDEQWNGIQIDVHEGCLPYKNIDYCDVDGILQRRHLHKDIYVVDPVDDSFIAFFKELLNNSKVDSVKYFEPLQETFATNEQQLLSLCSYRFSEVFINDFKRLMIDGFDEKAIRRLAAQGRRELVNSFARKISVWKDKIGRISRFFNRPGFSIAFLGADGAGKTTIIEALTPVLSEAMHGVVYYEHMRPNLTPNIAQALGKAKIDGATSNPHAGKQSGFCGSMCRLFYYLLDYIFGFWFKIYPAMLRSSCIFVFDRYYYDYFIDQKRACIKLPYGMIRCFEFFIPKPDLILCLGGDPEKIHARKAEIPLEEVKRQTKELKHLFERLPSAVWVDTDCKIETSVNTAMHAIINKMAESYE